MPHRWLLTPTLLMAGYWVVWFLAAPQARPGRFLGALTATGLTALLWAVAGILELRRTRADRAPADEGPGADRKA
jgi:hypothetical protein